MWRAFFRALFAAIREYLREKEIERAHNEALIEKAQRDAEDLARAGEAATRERMRDADIPSGVDVMRERMRNRDPGTR
jgi:hypothetical protein